MSKMVQIRNVPDGLHRELKIRAARASLSLSDFLLRELERVVQRPTPDELRARLLDREPVDLSRPASEWVREERDAR